MKKEKNRYCIFYIDDKAVKVMPWRVKNDRIHCRNCKKYLIKELFYVTWQSRSMNYQLTAYCKDCNSLINERNSRQKASDDYIYFLRRLERSAKSNAKSRGIEYKLAREWWDEQYKKQKGKCFYTEKTMTHCGTERKLTNISIDRVDSRGIYEPDNCVLCCLALNTKMKNDMTVSQLYDFARDFVTVYESRK